MTRRPTNVEPLRPARTVESWNGLAVAVSPDRALLTPEAADLLAKVIDFYSQRERMPLSPQLRHVRAVLILVARGHADVREEPAMPACTEWITSKEAARMLNVSTRHVTRLAEDGQLGQTTRSGLRWMIQRDEVTALAAARLSAS